jgi:hypothetical protein
VFLSRAPVFRHQFFIALILNQLQQMKGILSDLGASQSWFAVPKKQTHCVGFYHFTMGDLVQQNVSVLRYLMFSKCKYLNLHSWRRKSHVKIRWENDGKVIWYNFRQGDSGSKTSKIICYIL